jgi:hypothetical protein
MMGWLLAGLLLGALNALSLAWTVGRLQPQGAVWPALALVWGGAVLRWSLAVLLLSLALRQGILPGLGAFGGLWLARSLAVLWFGTQEEAWKRFSPG